jgi:hypothetical protein
MPSEVDSLKNLTSLDVSNNQLAGNMPSSLGDLTALTSLRLGGNHMSGSIPSSLGKLRNLSELNLAGNELGGTIPPELGNLANLGYLSLGGNRLGGEIPSWLGNLEKLSVLDLSANKLSGSVPSSLTSLTKCYVYIEYNALHTNDPNVANFLGQADFGWSETQTVAPSDLFAVVQPDSSTLVSWRPIPFTDNGGRYEVWTSTTSGGPYALAGSTVDKLSSSLLLTDISPGIHLVVRTVTDPHAFNPNQVVGDYSPEISVRFPAVSMDATLTAAGASISTTYGGTGSTQAGYAKVSLNPMSSPYGTAVFSYEQDGVVVSEAGVPASPPTTAARLFVDYRTGTTVPGTEGTFDVYTGFAITNCGDAPATITFTLRGLGAEIIASDRGSLGKDAHLAAYVHQLPDILPGFILPPSFPVSVGFGTLDLESNQPLSVVALRFTINQRYEMLMTSTPVVDLTRSPAGTPIYFPHLIVGEGFSLNLFLLNTSKSVETGRFNIFGDSGSPLPVHLPNGYTGSSFDYSIVPGGSYVFQTAAVPESTYGGWIELIPDGGMLTPAGAGILQFSRGSTLISESGIPSVIPTTHARVFIDLSSGHDTGVALGNPNRPPIDILVTAFQMDGTTQMGEPIWPAVSLTGKGHASSFIDYLISGLPADFRGILDVASGSPFAALTLRSLTEDPYLKQFPLPAFPVADLARPAPFPIVFPQIADGGGFKTEIILISAGQAAGAKISFYGDEGNPLAIGH